MEGAMIILAVTVAIGVILWAWEKARGGKPLHHHGHAQAAGEKPESEARGEERADGKAGENGLQQAPAVCCGLHAICEKTGKINEPPTYYDDEELDRYAGRDAGAYTDEEIEEFRDVLLTLLPSDAPGWAVSLERRRINLPSPLLPELELMLSEA